MSVEQVRFTGAVVPARAVLELDLGDVAAAASTDRDTEVDVLITGPGGEAIRLPAFRASSGTWRARFSTPEVGVHAWAMVVRQGKEADRTTGAGGSFEVAPYAGANPLLRHGAPEVGPDRRHLQHADGTPFLWLADTWWTGMMGRFEWPDIFQRLADDRAAKGFNVAQIVAGLVPEFTPFGPEMANEGGQPWTEQGAGDLNPAYFDVPDEKIDYLVGLGISPCVFGAWGYYAEMLGEANVRRHWRHLVARYGAYPVTWSIAGEVDLPLIVHATTPDLLVPPAEQTAIWERASVYVGEIDPFHRVRTVHPCPVFTYATSEAFESRSSFDLDMLQTGHTGIRCVASTMTHLRTALAHGDKPVLNGECSYEGIFDANWQDVQRFLFWSHMLSGAAGHTYGTMAISTFNRRDDPHVPLSRVSMHFWDDAIDWLGARHVGVGRRVLERHDWWTLQPIPERVAPHAGPDDWFLPFAGATASGKVLIYLPGEAMLESHGAIADWPRTLSRVSLSGLDSGRHRATWIDPRTGDPHADFVFDVPDGTHVFEESSS